MGRVKQLTSFDPPTAVQSKVAFDAFFKKKKIPSLKFGIRMNRHISSMKAKLAKQSQFETNEW